MRVGAVFSLPSVHAETGVSQVQILPARPFLLSERSFTKKPELVFEFIPQL